MKNLDGLVVEIFEDNVCVDERVIPARGDRSEMKLYSQVAFVHLGGRFPVEFSLSLEQGASAYPAGKYQLHASSFKVGQYGRLEFERNLLLVPLNPASIKAA
ncbi:single-stranded DNA-binding protein [Vibrio mediterranei]|uniref:Single-stranded DNA-binding protein n=1 Tax=Vibrio mediterranei TaxID=689 RepID=A0A3G4V551_9VIBR|nr:single-stranded DNA-binding protein [Vibrio mediterranei]AYV19812.1 hypothetical protein ECB94_00235 [Vibrio mediterranei]AYV19820.1 hypothetical protein ECB94_00280 [Vibrio mediterranei]